MIRQLIVPFTLVLLFTPACHQNRNDPSMAKRSAETSKLAPSDARDDDPTDDPTIEKLPGEVTSAPPGIKGFDCNTSVMGKARNFANAGYGFAIRYVPLVHDKTNKSDVTRAEAEAILDPGLALMLVQHGAGFKKSQSPSKKLGTYNGNNAFRYARELGYPSKAVLWLDLEGVQTGTTQDVIDYVTAWAAAISPHYSPGLYVGGQTKLNDKQLGGLPLQHFWKAGSNHHTSPSGRGYQLIQHGQATIAGIKVDNNHTQQDDQGGAVLWLQPEDWKAPPATLKG